MSLFSKPAIIPAVDVRKVGYKTLLTIAIFVVIIAVAGYVTLRQAYATARVTANKELKTIGDLKTEQISDWYGDRMADAHEILDNDLVQREAAAIIHGTTNTPDYLALMRWLKARQLSDKYARFALFDTNGRQILSYPAGTSKSEALDNPIFTAAIRAKNIQVEDLHQDGRSYPSQKKPLQLNVWIPVYIADNHDIPTSERISGKSAGRVEGAWLVQYDPDLVLYPLIQNWPTFSHTGETILVRKDGADVLYLNELRFRPNSAFRLRYNMQANPMLTSVMAVNGKTGVVQGIDYRGKAVLAAIRSVPGTPWFSMVKIDHAEVFRALKQRVWMIWSLIFILIVLVILGIGYRERSRDKQWIQKQFVLAKERLQYSERIANLTKYANDIILMLDKDCNILEANQKAIRTYGYSEAELKQMNLHDLRIPAERDRLSDLDWNSVVNEGIREETTHLSKDGRLINVESSIRSIVIDGEILQQAIIRDITERKQAEIALLENEVVLKESQRIAQLGSWYLDLASNQVKWSDELYKMYGFDPTLPPPPYTEHMKLFTAESWDRLSKALANTADSGIPYELELETVKIDGSNGWMWVFGKTLQDSDGKTVGLMGAAQDITERKIAETLLKESEKRYMGLITNLEAGVVVHAPDTSILMNNAKASELLGLSSEQMRGVVAIDPRWEFLREDGSPLPLDEYPVNQVLRSKNSLKGLILGGWRPDKQDIVWLLVNGFAAFDQDGQIAEIVISFLDITKRVEDAAEIKEIANRLQTVIDNAPFGAYTYTLDEADRLIFSGYNLAANRIKGFDHLGYLGKTLEEAFPQLADSDIPAINRSVIRTGIHVDRLESVYQGKDITEAYDVITIKTGENQVTVFFSEVTERIIADMRIKEMAARLQAVIDKAPFGALSYTVAEDNSLIFVNYNHPAQEILSFDLEPFIGKRYEEVFPNLDAVDYTEVYRQIALTGGNYELKDNDYSDDKVAGNYDVWALQTGLRVVTVFFIDVTQRKRAAQAIAENQARLKMSQEIGHTGSWEYDLQTGKIWGSQEAIRLYGFPPDNTELTLAQIEACRKPDDSINQALIDLIKHDTPYYVEFELFPADGSVSKFVSSKAVLIRDEHNNPIKVAGVFQDITEQKNNAAKLRASEALYRSILNASPDDITVTDLDGVTVMVSPAAVTLLGYGSQDDILGSKVSQFIHPEDIERATFNLAMMFQGVFLGAAEYRVLRADGSQFNAEINGDFIRDAAGEPTGIVFIVRDVTERKQAEAEIKALNENLEQKVAERTSQLTTAMKELEAFSYSVSHDLRAPLRGIDGWSLVLLEDYQDKLDAVAKQCLQTIRNEAQNMSGLIDALLNLSKVSRGEMASIVTDLSLLAGSVVKRLTAAESARQIEVTIQPGMQDSCDPRLMQIAFVNLIGNALKFSASRQVTRVEIGTVDIAGKAVYFIKDNGVGFDMNYAGKLFGTFQRLHKASEYEGTGIGLATVKRIINRHGGEIWAEAVPDKYAIFYFTLNSLPLYIEQYPGTAK